jgi:excisionase family DNA binding protein
MDYSSWIPKGEAAEQLGLSERTLERLIQKRKLKLAYRRIPGRRPIAVLRPEDVEQLRAETIAPLSDAEVQALPAAGESRALSLPLRRLDNLLAAQPRPVRRFLTIPEAADYVGLPQGYLLRMVRSGKLPGLKAGGWRVRKEDLDKL